jgi:zinc transport system permease protein
MTELWQYEFMRHALAAAVLASIACGLVGVLVVVKKIVSISGGIAHSAFGGIGLGYLLKIDPLLTVLPFSLLAAGGIGLLTRKTKIPEDTAIGIFWTVCVALGVIFIGLTPGYAPDLFSYLFGNILTVPASDLYLMAVLDAVIIFLVVFCYRGFLAVSFDEEYAEVLNLPVTFLYLLLLGLVALTVVVLMKIVGIILVMALLTLPAAIARTFTANLRKMMILAILEGIFFTVAGVIFSYYFNLASGALIVLFLGAGFVLVQGIHF